MSSPLSQQPDPWSLLCHWPQEFTLDKMFYPRMTEAGKAEIYYLFVSCWCQALNWILYFL